MKRKLCHIFLIVLVLLLSATLSIFASTDSVDKSLLFEVLDSFDNMVESDYTVDSWTYAADRIYMGRVFLYDTDATQVQIDAAVKSIKNAMLKLEYKPIDRTELDKYLLDLNSLDLNNYRGDSLKEIKKALEMGNSDFVKQSDVDDAANEVKRVFSYYVNVYNAEHLSALMEECKKLEASDYTDASFKRLKDAVIVAETAQTLVSKHTAYNFLLRVKKSLVNIKELKKLLSQIPENREDCLNDDNFWIKINQMKEAGEERIVSHQISQENIDEFCVELKALLGELKLKESDATISENLNNAWSDYISQYGSSPFAIDNNANSLDFKTVIIAVGVIAAAAIFVGAGVYFSKKNK